MTIHLPADLEGFIQAEVLKGRFGSADELVVAAVRDFLQHTRPTGAEAATGPAAPAEEPIAQELQRRLFERGVIGEIKGPITDLAPYRNRQAVPIQGEPLSETVLRERR